MGFWGRSHDHIGNFNYRVEIEGLVLGSFKAVEGMGSETEVITFGGATDQLVKKMPGRHKFTDITLKRGFTNDSTLFEWRQAVVDGVVERRSGSIIICDDDGSEITRFNFFHAWPTKWKGGSLDGMGNEGVVEEMTLTVEGLEKG